MKHDEHLDRQDADQLPTDVGAPTQPPVCQELGLQASETVRRIVDGEPR
jgi:hypothetical protein